MPNLESRVQALEEKQQHHHVALYGDNDHIGLLPRTRTLETNAAAEKKTRWWIISVVVGIIVNIVLTLLPWLLKH